MSPKEFLAATAPLRKRPREPYYFELSEKVQYQVLMSTKLENPPTGSQKPPTAQEQEPMPPTEGHPDAPAQEPEAEKKTRNRPSLDDYAACLATPLSEEYTVENRLEDLAKLIPFCNDGIRKAQATLTVLKPMREKAIVMQASDSLAKVGISLTDEQLAKLKELSA